MILRTLFGLVLLALALPSAETPAQRDERMQWWREARFGMFIHWGLYSGLAGTWEGKPVATRGGMEWIQQRVKADTDTYAAKAKPLFKPAPGVAREWAKLAKAAGMKYAVLTSKHHDGFALFDSKLTEYDVGSVLQRDLVREFIEAFRAEGIRVGLYHSVIDWHHDQYEYARSKQLPHPLIAKPYPAGSRDHAKYLEFLHGQVNELVSNYGKLDILWWDYSSQDFQGDGAWRAFDLMAKVRARQPQIIMNNRLFRIPEAGFTGMGTAAISMQLNPKYGDFITPEQHIPAAGLPGVDWETCMTMNTTWGYSEHDKAWKSNQELIRGLVDAVSKGGNLLLNIGPKADGAVPEPSVEGLRAMGAWMKVNGEAIYGTTACSFEKLGWGRCTQKKSRLYLHVFDWPASGRLSLPLRENVKSARWLANGQAVKTSREGDQLVLAVGAQARDKIASVLALELR